MAFYCQCMLEMALILTEYDQKMYEEIAFKFIQHFLWIAYAMDRRGEHHDEMWDEQDGFFYDLLRLPDGQAMRLKVRSLVGLLPLCASTVFAADAADRYPRLFEMIALFRKRHPEVVSHVAPTREGFIGYKGRRLLSILNKQKLERVLAYLLDENEFLDLTAFALCRGITWIIRLCLTSVIRNTRSSTCPANRIPACSAATPIGADRSGCRSMR